MDGEPSIDEVASRYAAARTSWLEQTIRSLRSDLRVAALVLTGSLGRGESDDWSDVDVVVVFREDAVDWLPQRESFGRECGDALFVFDSPWNAPLDGAQVNALYDVGGEWPLYVDWDCGRAIAARSRTMSECSSTTWAS
jgi:UTP:GlnB (protein PII) uridylyltransferase